MSTVGAVGANASMDFSPVRPKSLPESVAEQMMEAIVSGRLKPGERLVEQKLAALFGIGQPTVREALKQLEYQGLVRKLPNRATYVTELSASDVEKIFEVRMALETLAIEKAAANLTPNALVELREHLAAMEKAARATDLPAFHQSDLAFHRVIWDLSGNEHLSAALDRIAFSLFAFVLLKYREEKTGYAAAVTQHRQIMDGLATQDPAKASRIFQQCTMRYWRQYRNLQLGAPGKKHSPRKSVGKTT
jgi:DNA-binding GntR family transcriptional regulator